MTFYITNTQHFECAYCGAEKTVRNFEDMDYSKCEHRDEWICFDCATKHPSGENKCRAWWAEIGVAAVLFLMVGCTGSSHYVPLPSSQEPCENLQYPNREPYQWELSKIKKLKAEGKCGELEKYLKKLREE